MTEEHVVLLDEQDKPSGTLEKYAAHTLIRLCIWLSPAGYLTKMVSCW